MALLHQLFTVPELNALDEKQLDILWTAIQLEILTSREVQDALRQRARDVFSQLSGGVPPEGPTEAEAPRRRPRRRK
jgi:hypothetical protein